MKSIIRHSLLLLFVILLMPGMINAKKIQHVEFRYTLDHFPIFYRDSLMDVSCLVPYGGKTPTQPAIPALYPYVPVPKGMKCVEFRYEIPDTLVVCEGKGVLREPYPELPPSAWEAYKRGEVEIQEREPDPEPDPELTGVYPTSGKKIMYDREHNGVCLYPFEYDFNTKTLIFTPTIIVDMVLEPIEDVDNSSSIQSGDINDDEDEIIEIIIFEGIYERHYSPQNFKLTPDYDIIEDPAIKDPIDYIVITDEILEDSFSPLIKWKTQKGLRCRVKTIQDIEKEYKNKGATTQLRIKSYIHDMYINHGASYVLLDGYVPPAMAKSVVRTTSQTYVDTIPTDLYYACFDGQFDWNADKDDIIGEEEDSISMIPNIIVTRLPVHHPQHVTNFVYKVIGYEKEPKVNCNMLMEGAYMEKSISTERPDGSKVEISDGQYQSEKLYETFIQPNWEGRLWTVYGHPKGEPQEESLAGGIGVALRRGYGFIDIQCHGEPDKWIFRKKKNNDDPGDIFYSADAKATVNPAYTVITSTACDVNSFDDHLSIGDPCISQALISEPRNGVVAFLGSSRTGWGYSNEHLGPFQVNIGTFYSLLFNSDPDGIAENVPKNFGKLTAATKKKLYFYAQGNPLFRWLQLSINPVGDPEMPLFYGFKKLFNDIDVSVKSGTLKVDTGVEGCVICLTGEQKGKPYQKVFRDVQSATFTVIPDNAVLCVTKQNYKPYIQELSNPNGRAMALSAYGEISSVAVNPSELTVGLYIDEFASESYLVLTEAMSNKQTLLEVSPDEGSVNIDTSFMPGGIYILNLYVDGFLKDSKRFMIK